MQKSRFFEDRIGHQKIRGVIDESNIRRGFAERVESMLRNGDRIEQSHLEDKGS